MGAPRIVLMSATADSELFCRYMGGCPSVSIPGRTFPVEKCYLEDVIQSTRFRPQVERQPNVPENATLTNMFLFHHHLVVVTGMLIYY